MNCREAGPLLHARLDNELDVAGASDVDCHLAECRVCAAQYAALENLQREIAGAGLRYVRPAPLERNLAARFTSDRPGRWWRSTAVALFAAACLALLIIFLPMSRNTGAPNAIATEILDNHLRALQPGHLFDVESTDQHTVKPWFQGRTDFSPPVPDLTADGFSLVGGRLEVIHRQSSAALVYQRRRHLISLYILPSPGAPSKPELQEIDGYHLLHWGQGNLDYWAVSDVSPADLRDFAAFFEPSNGSAVPRVNQPSPR